MNFKSEQEAFWAGDFGKDYIQRNQSKELLASNINFFSKALKQALGLNSCVEFGEGAAIARTPPAASENVPLSNEIGINRGQVPQI